MLKPPMRRLYDDLLSMGIELKSKDPEYHGIAKQSERD
jgi:hypothetical protein